MAREGRAHTIEPRALVHTLKNLNTFTQCIQTFYVHQRESTAISARRHVPVLHLWFLSGRAYSQRTPRAALSFWTVFDMSLLSLTTFRSIPAVPLSGGGG